MAETLYIITTGGDILTIDEVTALAIDNTLTIEPGDYYRNEWTEQDEMSSPDQAITKTKGDAVTGAALKTESWLCSFWKFTRGASLPIFYVKWADVIAICNLMPNTEDDTAQIYVPLINGGIAVYSGITASTTSITINSSLTVYPGDYYRDEWTDEDAGISVALVNQYGDAVTNVALHAESWGCSHYALARSGLITLYIPWSNVRGGPTTEFPLVA